MKANTERNWSMFEKPRQGRGHPYATLEKGLNISLPGHATKHFKKYITIYNLGNLLGIKTSDTKTSNSYKGKKQKNSNRVRFCVKSFLKFYGIKAAPGRYHIERDNDMWIVDFSKRVEE